MKAQQIGKDWYKIGTKAQLPHINANVAVFKRSGPFSWELDHEFEDLETAVMYLSYLEMMSYAERSCA